MPTITALEEFLRNDDDTYYSRPTVEEGHTKRCLASAIISAVENLRDDEFFGDHDFALAAQDNNFLSLAHEYLNSEIADCICPQRLRIGQYTWVVHFVNPLDPDNYVSFVWFGTLEKVIELAHEYTLVMEVFSHITIGREPYAGDPREVFWESYDAPLVEAS